MREHKCIEEKSKTTVVAKRIGKSGRVKFGGVN